MSKIKNFKILCSILNRSNNSDNIDVLKKNIIDKKIIWEEIVAIANQEYLIPALYYSLKEKNLFQYINDNKLHEYLLAIYEFNTQRNLQILDQLLDLNKIFTSVNITPLFLKGSASLCENNYDEIGIRSLTDIDIYIENSELQVSLNKLLQNGYSFLRDKSEQTLNEYFHHLEPISKLGMPTSVELHRTVLGNKAANFMLKTKDYITDCSNSDFFGVKIFIPTYFIFHAFLHTELQDDNHKFKRLDLRHLYDFTILVNKYNNEIDWQLLNNLVKETKCKEILEDYLYLIKMFFSLETPLTVENEKTVRHYKRVLKVIELEGTILENFYPLPAHLPKIFEAYSRKRLRSHYNFNSTFGYIFAIIKRFFFHIKEMGRYFTS